MRGQKNLQICANVKNGCETRPYYLRLWKIKRGCKLKFPIGLLRETAHAKTRKATLLGHFYGVPLGYTLMGNFKEMKF